MENWTPVEPQLSSAPAIPTPEVRVSPNLRATLPLPLQYSPDTLKQYNRPWLSSFRISPLPPGGVPAINSATSSTIRTIISQSGGAGIDFQTNSVNNAEQNKLNLRNGTGILLTSDVSGGVTVALFVPVTLVDGGTGSDLSGTGGAHKFVAQSSVGANLTVVQPAFTDISGVASPSQIPFPTASTIGGVESISVVTHNFLTGISTLGVPSQAQPAFADLTGAGTITTYNSISTVSNGVPSELAVSDLTGKSAAITATTLYAVPASGQGMYRISWSADITTADAVSSTLGGAGGFQVLYTSPTDNVVKTTTTEADKTSTQNTTATAVGGVMVVYAKASTNIQYTFGYTSNTPGQMVYEIHIKVEAL